MRQLLHLKQAAVHTAYPRYESLVPYLLLHWENHYGPFGLNLMGIDQADVPNSQFQYHGQEKRNDFGLHWSNYGTRMYDPQLGRWHAVDP